MTLLLIILITFILLEINSKTTLTAKSKECSRKSKSNAKLQYDVACSIIKEMGATYREYLSTITINEYLYNGTNNKDNYNNLLEIKFVCGRPEYAWLISTIKASCLNADKDCMKIIYGEKIWEFLPDTYSEEFLQRWIEKFSLTNVKKEDLKNQLNRIITLKQEILHDEKNGNSYVAYNNPYALNYVAQKFNLPTIEEKRKISVCEYKNLQDLCFDYTCRHSKTKGKEYKHIPLTMICEDPTEEQKKLQYAKLSDSENFRMNLKKEKNIRNKYDL